MRRVVIAHVKYRIKNDINEATGSAPVYTPSMPPLMFESSIAPPSLVAHIASHKVTEGMPLFRLEEPFLAEGVPIDRGLMSRSLEQTGANLGATAVNAMRNHALGTASQTGLASSPRNLASSVIKANSPPGKLSSRQSNPPSLPLTCLWRNPCVSLVTPKNSNPML